MGATNIEVRAYGKNIQEAFRNAQRAAEEEHGTDSYNGEINNCSLSKDVTAKQHEFDEEDFFHEWILDRVSKRDVYGYCTVKPVENNNKIKTVVTNYPQKGTRKWVTKYIALDKWKGDVIYEAESQTECIKKARVYVEKHPKVRVEVQIQKTLVGGKNKVADIDYKASSKERMGSYTFVGWAPC